MSDRSKIEWCDTTWNVATGCSKVSQGCKNCFAERIAGRFWGERKFTDVQVHPERLDIPLRWRKPRRVFVNSMSDLFHPAVPFEFILQAFTVMAQAEQHTFMVLTKRPERMVEYFKWNGFGEGLYAWPSWIWLGVSVEDQKAADERIPLLLQTPAAVRFLSCEPLLGPVDLTNTFNTVVPLHWVIAGGESGPGARPMHPDWVRSLRDQCQAAGVPYFFKQWGEWFPLPPEIDDESAPDEIVLGHYRDEYYNRDGEYLGWWDVKADYGESWGKDDESTICFVKVGKKAAGRLLDGREWNEYPEA
jgi:protein gp37